MQFIVRECFHIGNLFKEVGTVLTEAEVAFVRESNELLQRCTQVQLPVETRKPQKGEAEQPATDVDSTPSEAPKAAKKSA